MPATIDSVSYDDTLHKNTITVSGGSSGTLTLYRDQSPSDDSRTVDLITTDTSYDGTSTAYADYTRQTQGSVTYYVYIDDVQQDSSTQSDVTVVHDWLISLTDPDTTLKICTVRERERGMNRRRRGWYGNVVGSVRTVAVTDVAMGGETGSFTVLSDTWADLKALDLLLRQGVVCRRPPDNAKRTRGQYMLIEDYQTRPVHGGHQPPFYTDVRWVRTWPAGLRQTLPDD